MRSDDTSARIFAAHTLLRLTFDGGGPRLRYEARRKLYLTKLLFDIDHTRAVRDGRRHQSLSERVLREKLWNDLDRSAIDFAATAHDSSVSWMPGQRTGRPTRRDRQRARAAGRF